MATKKATSKISLNRDKICKFCKKGFAKESTLASHMCPKKKRYADRDEKTSRLGFRIFQKFYEVTMYSKKPKTIEDFIGSTYYIAFVKFARYLIALDPINSEQFIEHVLRTGVNIDKWCDEKVYITFLQDYIRKEPAMKAAERTIISMQEWADEQGDTYSNFFTNVHPIEAAYLIRRGKISPWIIYLSADGNTMLNKFGSEQVTLIADIIDSDFWGTHIMNNREDMKTIKEVLGVAGI